MANLGLSFCPCAMQSAVELKNLSYKTADASLMIKNHLT